MGDNYSVAQEVHPTLPQAGQVAPVAVECVWGAQEARASAPTVDRVSSSFFIVSVAGRLFGWRNSGGSLFPKIFLAESVFWLPAPAEARTTCDLISCPVIRSRGSYSCPR